MRPKISSVPMLLMAWMFIVGAKGNSQSINDKSRYDFGTQSCVVAPQGTCQDGFVGKCNSCGGAPRVEESDLYFKGVEWAQNSSGGKNRRCYRESLRHSPAWISSAMWVDSSSQIMVVDPQKHEVILYSIKGLQVNPPFAVDGKKVKSGAKGRNEYILKLLNSRAVVLDEGLGVADADGNFQKDKAGRTNSLGSLYDWAVANDRIFGFGAIKISGQYQSGFLGGNIGGVPLSVDGMQLLEPFDYLDYYLLGYQYVAVNESEAFFLKMGDFADLYRVPLGGGKLESIKQLIPADFSHVPKIKTQDAGPAEAKKLYEEIEGYKIPAGIYGYGKMLYFLARSPEGKGTAWWLYQIDSAKKVVSPGLRLPTHASNLTLVPSPDFWFIFEKSGIKDDNSQDINDILAVPAQWIVDPASSPLKRKSNNVECGSFGGDKS